MALSASAATTPSDAPQGEGKLRVMVVDDEADTVLTLLDLLRDEGYQVDGFGSGRAALDAFADMDPDVVISDIAMPAPNGWDLAKEVRKRTSNRPRPFMIAISGKYMKSADRMLAQISGFNYFLTKPCDPQVLLALIRSNAQRK